MSLALLLLLLLPVNGGAAVHTLHLLVGHERDPHEHFRRRALRSAIEEPAVWRDVAVVAPGREAKVVSGGESAVGWIESHPPAVGTADFRPRVGLALDECLIT